MHKILGWITAVLALGWVGYAVWVLGLEEVNSLTSGLGSGFWCMPVQLQVLRSGSPKNFSNTSGVELPKSWALTMTNGSTNRRPKQPLGNFLGNGVAN